MGEGWHNNHHAYQSSARQGFRWWEVDPTFYILKTQSFFGLVWDLKTPPLEVRRNQHRLDWRGIERAAGQLAGSQLAQGEGRPLGNWAQPPKQWSSAHEERIR
jgi:stearoyl-CoA desaturase (Delta-9 desaturase)